MFNDLGFTVLDFAFHSNDPNAWNLIENWYNDYVTYNGEGKIAKSDSYIPGVDVENGLYEDNMKLILLW